MARKTPDDLNLENLENENENDDVVEYVEGPDGEYVEKRKTKKTVEAGEKTTKTPENVSEVQETMRPDLAEDLTVSGMGLPTKLTPEQLAKVSDMKNAIDINDVSTIIEFGSQEQSGINQVLAYIGDKRKTKDINAIGEYLNDLQATLRNQVNAGSGSRSIGIVRKLKERFLAIRDGNRTVDVNIDSIEGTVQGHIGVLQRDLEALQQVWDINQDRFYELELYRKAGMQKLKEMEQEIEEKRKEFEESDGKLDDMEREILANMMHSMDLLEKKIHNLYVSQTIAVQTAAQLQMLKKVDIALQESLQDSIVTAIPQWRMSSTLSIALQDSQMAANVTKAMSDATNEMLRKNAEMLGTVTRDVARQSERPMVETETLEKVFIEISEALTDSAKIADEGRRKRAEGEKKLEALQKKMVTNQTKGLDAPKDKKGK